MATCIFRAAKKAGIACGARTCHGTRFCASHRRTSNPYFLCKIDTFIGNAPAVSATNIYTCLDNLWKSPSIDNAFLAVEILTYLLDHPAITRMAAALHIDPPKQKMSAALDIVAAMWKVWTVSQNPRALAAIALVQKKWRASRTADVINSDDPFTLEAIADLPRDRAFRFSEHGRIYVFDGPSFYKHVHIHKNHSNPLTREPLALSVTAALMRFSGAALEPTEWQSISVAFTDVATEIERRHDIAIQPAWLIALSASDIDSIYIDYHHLTVHEGSFMRDYAVSSKQIWLASEMMRMINAESQPSFFVCCAVVAIARQCDPLHRSLPNWVFDAAQV
jgi:hypothetical protein